jgi:hypothetical protein
LLQNLMLGGGALATGLVSWGLSKYYPVRLRQMAQGLVLLLLLAWCLLAVTGWVRGPGGVADAVHHWTPHVLTWPVWFVIAFCVGQFIRHWPWGSAWAAVFGTLLALASGGLWVLAAFTGYLGPSRVPHEPGGMTLVRFQIAHLGVLPTLLLLCLVLWLAVLVPRGRPPSGPTGDNHGAEGSGSK